MNLPTIKSQSAKTFLSYPALPEPPAEATEELKEFHRSLIDWYDDLQQLLQRDRDEILAKISKLS